MEKMTSPIAPVRVGAALRRCAVVAGFSLALVATGPIAAQATPGAPAGAGRPAAAPRTLCDSIAQLDRLVVTRTVVSASNHIRFSFPAAVKVSDQAAVQLAARAVCALPVMPRKPISCPVDLGITYRLSFTEQLPPVNQAQSANGVVVAATGCQALSGLEWTRWAARSPKFWPELGKAMGLKNPTWATFRGSGGAAG
jgi:hypothetical protein